MKKLLQLLLLILIIGTTSMKIRKTQMISSMRCMFERRVHSLEKYILFNIRHGILSKDLKVSWHPKNFYTHHHHHHRVVASTKRLRFYSTRAYLDKTIPLFYANINKRNQC